MFNRILVPLDGSKLAERAIPHAEQFARIFGSSVTLLQVLEPGCHQDIQGPVDPLSWQIRKTEADTYLKGIAAGIEENLRGGAAGEDEKKSRVNYSIQEGKTAENIVDFAHTENIDLLVISTHGSSGLSRWNISSIVQKVINLVYLPVLIVRTYNSPNSDEDLIHYHRILLPIDSSRRSECSLAAGIALARGETPEAALSEPASFLSMPPVADPSPSNVKLLLTAIIKPLEIPIPEPYPVEISELSEQLMKVSREAVHNYLNEMNERLPANSETRIVESDSVASAIHQLAEEEEVDLVILCAHGYSGQYTWPYGSVTRNYLEHGTRSILVIQDVHRSQLRPGAAEKAAEESVRR